MCKIEQKILLSYPDFSKLFILNVDCGERTSSAELYYMDNGGKKTIAFNSSKLHGNQLLWSTPKKELYTALLMCKKFNFYLLGHPFVLLMDSKYISLITKNLNKNKNNKYLTFWIVELFNTFNPTIYLISRNSNLITDALTSVQQTTVHSNTVSVSNKFLDEEDNTNLTKFITNEKEIYLILQHAHFTHMGINLMISYLKFVLNVSFQNMTKRVSDFLEMCSM